MKEESRGGSRNNILTEEHPWRRLIEKAQSQGEFTVLRHASRHILWLGFSLLNEIV